MTTKTNGVFVDNARNKLGRMLMSHMLAWDVNDLRAMARAIGIDRKHFQGAKFRNGRCMPPRYDICQAKRADAIKRGAKVIDRKGVGQFIKAKRAKYEETMQDIIKQIRMGDAPDGR